MKKRDILCAIAPFCSNILISDTVCGSNIICNPIRKAAKCQTTNLGMIPLQKINYKNDGNATLIKSDKFDLIHTFFSNLYEGMKSVDGATNTSQGFQAILSFVSEESHNLARNKFFPDEKERDETIKLCDSILIYYSGGKLLKSLYATPQYLNEIPQDLQTQIIQNLLNIVKPLKVVSDITKSPGEKERILLATLFEPNEFTTPERIHLIMNKTKPETRTYLNWLPNNTTWTEFFINEIRKFLKLIDGFLKNEITLYELEKQQHGVGIISSIIHKIRQSNFLYEESKHAAEITTYNKARTQALADFKKDGNKGKYAKTVHKLVRKLPKILDFSTEIKEKDGRVDKEWGQFLLDIEEKIKDLCVFSERNIQLECTKIISKLLWSFDYRIRNDFSFFPKVSILLKKNIAYGTGTLVTWDTLPKVLQNRVVLSCSHIYVDYYLNNSDILDLEDKTKKAGIPYFITPKGDLVFYGEPEKYQFENFESSQKLLFSGIDIEYWFLNIAQDLAIYILKQPLKYSIKSIGISSATLSEDELNSPNFYHIGFCREPLTKKRQKYAVGPYKFRLNKTKNEYQQVPNLNRPGNSGSPIIYRNPNTSALSIVGVVTGPECPYLDDAQMAWIQKAAQIYTNSSDK